MRPSEFQPLPGRDPYLKLAQFSDNLDDLDWIIWPVLQVKNFRKDDLEKFEKYQAEALVHKNVPVSALLGVGCYNDSVRDEVKALADSKGKKLKVLTRRTWYL